MEKRALNWSGSDNFTCASVLEINEMVVASISVGSRGYGKEGWLISFVCGPHVHYAPHLPGGVSLEEAKRRAEDWLFSGMSFCPLPSAPKESEKRK
jgi:hypothetical protein